jgi:hypothetical protein
MNHRNKVLNRNNLLNGLMAGAVALTLSACGSNHSSGGGGGTGDTGGGAVTQTLAAFGYNVCRILTDTSLKCRGRNNYGQLGQGDLTYRGDNAREMGDNLTAIDL